MRFSQDFIEKVRESNNIGEIIGQHTELKGTGHRLMGRCPFPDHSDKSPSFSVTEDNQLYYCYGCKKGGNVFNFLETYNGMSFPEAIEFLARRAGIPLPEKAEAQRRPGHMTSDQKDVYLKINKLAAVFFHQQLNELPEDHAAKKYLVKRGLTEEIVEKFRLGVTLDEWQGLAKTLEAKGAPLKLAEGLGLLKPKKNPPKTSSQADQYFDLFRDRLMFPIFSPTSDVIGFGGRTLGDAMPKYVNSSDSPVFNKSKILYGLHETGKFIRAQDEAIVVEGYMDAISLYAAGIKNVVAILGTAFTADHAKLLKRYTLNVKMLLDGDEAGINAADRSLPVLLEGGLMPKGFILPEKMDPDDYVKANGPDVLRTDLERAPELFTLLLTKRWMANYHGSPSEKVQIIQEAANAVKTMPNKQLFELYLMELARQLDVDMGFVRRALQTNAQSAPKVYTKTASTAGDTTKDTSEEDEHQSQNTTEEPLRKLVLKGAPKDEAFVLSLLLHSEQLMREFVEAGPEEVLKMMSHSGVRDTALRAVELFRAKKIAHASLAANLAGEVDEPGLLAASVALIPENPADGFERKLMADYMVAIKTRFLKKQGKDFVSQLRDQPSPEKLREFMEIQRGRFNRGDN
ncbi:MAG: DNA primase [Bdellovibrionota bacterium]